MPDNPCDRARIFVLSIRLRLWTKRMNGHPLTQSWTGRLRNGPRIEDQALQPSRDSRGTTYVFICISVIDTTFKVCRKLKLSYKSSKELDNIIDTRLPSRPRFIRKQIIVGGKAFDVYIRDVVKCVESLFGDPAFAPVLVFSPERHYSDKDQTQRLYHEMHTGTWWWETQVSSV
jgi:hypothetical protein